MLGKRANLNASSGWLDLLAHRSSQAGMYVVAAGKTRLQTRASVWLARDENEKKWVALKIVDSQHSASTSAKSTLSRPALRDSGS